MEKKVLSICIPTYNRKEVLIDEIKQYLSVPDERFCIKVNDNCSTDGTVTALSQIHDDRLIVSRNEKNEGSVPNWMKALLNCNSEYVIFVLDKDLVDIKYLSAFIDYLVSDKPNFGYVDLDINKQKKMINYSKGYQSILHMCYLDKHPSGYFYKKDIFEEAFEDSSFQLIDKTFIFPFEVLNGSISVKYQSTIVVWPLIVNAALRVKKDTRTLSFNEKNIWFGFDKRKLEFSYYLNNVLGLHIPLCEKKKISLKILKVAIGNVTYGLKSMLKNKEACYHYYVSCRKVSVREMTNNMKTFLAFYCTSCIGVFDKKTILQNMLLASWSATVGIIKSFK